MTDVEQAMEELRDEATAIDQLVSDAEKQFGDTLIANTLGPIPEPTIRDFAH